MADLLYRQNTPESLRRAVKLAPDNAVYRALLAENLEGLNQDPSSQLIETTRLSPLDSQYWIRRAFRAEIEGRYPETEALLLEAARVDHKANPRWALMNFYFRRGSTDQFWRWVTNALSVSRDDVSAIFRLAWDQSQDASFILGHIPNRQDLMIRYFSYLGDSGKLDDAHDVAVRVARMAPDASLGALLSYCGRYADGNSRRALEVWNLLCARKMIPFRQLDPAVGQILTNPGFAAEPTQQGFDWRTTPQDGVSIAAGEAGGISIELTGNQPEECILMEQVLPLSPSRRYEISWESAVAGGAEVGGLFWELAENGRGAQPTRVGISGTEVATAGRMNFTALAQSGRLRLGYKRPLGSVRGRGVVTLRFLQGKLAQ